MVARAWSGLMCLETQGPRGGGQTLDLGGAAESLARGPLEGTYVSEDPRSKPRLRLVAARHARDQPLGLKRVICVTINLVEAIVQPRLYDCLMVTQITLKTEGPHGLPSGRRSGG